MSLTSISASGGSFSPTNRAVTLYKMMFNEKLLRFSTQTHRMKRHHKYCLRFNYLTPVCRFRNICSSLASSTFDLNDKRRQLIKLYSRAKHKSIDESEVTVHLATFTAFCSCGTFKTYISPELFSSLFLLIIRRLLPLPKVFATWHY